MSEKEFDKIEKLHYGFYVQAVSGLLGAIAKEQYEKMNRWQFVLLRCFRTSIFSSFSDFILFEGFFC